MAGPRMLRDNGARYAMVALGGIMLMAVLNHYRSSGALLGGAKGPHLEVRVYCNDRTANGARGTLRPLLSNDANTGGRIHHQDTSGRSGELVLRVPSPTPPDWTADLYLAAPGCLTERLTVHSTPVERTTTLATLSSVGPPWDLADAPDAEAFPPKASGEKLDALRRGDVFATQRYYLFDGPTPSCSQCHQKSAEEHATGHGRAASVRLLGMVASAPEAERALCARCHAPVSSGGTQDGLAGVPAAGGFSCAVCHQMDVEHVPPGQGVGPASRFLSADDRRTFALGTRPDTSSPVMAVAYQPALHGEALCAACHTQARVTSGALLLVDPTMAEHAAWKQLPDHANTTCQSCHFKPTDDAGLVQGAAWHMWGVDRAEQPRKSHRTLTPFSDAIRTRLVLEGGDLVLTMTNVGASHALPGVKPLLAWQAVITSAARAVSGPTLGDGSPGVLLQRSFKDASGKGCAPPWAAEQLDDDTRLQPQQPRTWRWRVEGPGKEQPRVDIRVVDACTGAVVETLFSTSLEERPRGPSGPKPSPE